MFSPYFLPISLFLISPASLLCTWNTSNPSCFASLIDSLMATLCSAWARAWEDTAWGSQSATRAWVGKTQKMTNANVERKGEKGTARDRARMLSWIATSLKFVFLKRWADSISFFLKQSLKFKYRIRENQEYRWKPRDKQKINRNHRKKQRWKTLKEGEGERERGETGGKPPAMLRSASCDSRSRQPRANESIGKEREHIRNRGRCCN